MIIMYEVDLRSRRTGDSVECIYSGEDYDRAYQIEEDWNTLNVADYDPDRNWEDYVDGQAGLFACVYHIEDAELVHGVGKF